MKAAETYEGTPCRRAGHTLRYRSNGNCVACNPVWQRAYYEANREKVVVRQRANKEARRDQGLCANCGQPRLSEWYCWDCLDKKQFGAIKRQAIERGTDECHPSLTTPGEMPSTQLARLSALK